MAQKTFFAVKDLDGDGKHYCAVAFESKLAREAFCELNGYEPVGIRGSVLSEMPIPVSSTSN